MWLSLLTVVSLAAAPASNPGFDSGVQALQRKDAKAAQAGFEACLAAEPQRAECAWELGWAHWIQGDWKKVVEAWERVEKLNPAYPELEENLRLAKSQVELYALLARYAKEKVPARPTPPENARLRLRAVGDMMLGTDAPEGFLPPDDGAKLLDDVKSWLEDADLTFANLEGPLCDSGFSKKCGPKQTESCYAFRSPTRYGQYYKDVGIDVVSTANNHSGDFGEECRRETEKTLDALGIAWSGPPGSIAYLKSNGLTMGLVAFHTSLGCNYLNDTEAATALVKMASARSDVVVVSFHGGAEGAKYQHVAMGPETFYGEDRGDLRMFARAVIDAGADLVIGHGPHVLRAMEIYKKRLIAYSLGNFATYGRFNLKGVNGLGAVLDVTVDGTGRFVSGRVLPTKQVAEGIPMKDLGREAFEVLRQLSKEDFPKTGVGLDAEGNIVPAVVVPGDDADDVAAAPAKVSPTPDKKTDKKLKPGKKAKGSRKGNNGRR